MTTLSLSDALKIQEGQVAVFSRYLDDELREQFVRRVREETRIPENSDLHEKLPYRDAHTIVPCGLHLEQILREFTNAELIPPD